MLTIDTIIHYIIVFLIKSIAQLAAIVIAFVTYLILSDLASNIKY